MLKLIIFSLLVLGYILLFFADRKKALLMLFLIKLPLDQIAWKFSIPIVFTQLRISEAFTVFITLLLLATFLLDKTRDPDRMGFFKHVPSMLIIPIIIFMLVFFLNIFRGGWWLLSVQQFFKLITGIVVGTYVAKTLKTEDEINWLLRCMLFSMAIISVLSIPAIYSGGELHVYVSLSSEDKYVGTSFGGGVGNYYAADSFSNAFMVYIPAVLFASTMFKSKWEKILCLIVIMFSIVAVFVSAIRAGWLALALVLAIWMLAKRQWKLIAISAFCLFMIMTLQLFSNPLQKAYQKIAYEADSLEKGELPLNAFGGRPLSLKTYVGYYMDAPLLDKLTGNDRILILGSRAIGHDPHNDFLYILIRNGIIGLTAALCLYIVTGVYLFKAIHYTKEIYDWNLVLTAILAFLCMMIPSLTRTGLMNPNYEWVFWTFTMITLKRYIISKNFLPQSEISLNIDENSENIVSEIT